jgi:23S rRNA-/tRNA-specific pseudouridylate synthase
MTMNTNQYRSHPVAAALVATIVTTVLVATLVESFEPAQLIRFDRDASGDLIVALERRTAAGSSQA